MEFKSQLERPASTGKNFVLIVIISFSVFVFVTEKERHTQREHVFVCMWITCIFRHMCTCVYLCVKATDQSRWSILRSSPLWFLRQGLSLGLGLTH